MPFSSFVQSMDDPTFKVAENRRPKSRVVIGKGTGVFTGSIPALPDDPPGAPRRDVIVTVIPEPDVDLETLNWEALGKIAGILIKTVAGIKNSVTPSTPGGSGGSSTTQTVSNNVSVTNNTGTIIFGCPPPPKPPQ